MSYKEKLDKIADSLLQDNWLDDVYTIDLQYIFNQMSMKQRQVVEHLIEGLSISEIAQRLRLSISQVYRHRKEAKRKFLSVLICYGKERAISQREKWLWKKYYMWDQS